MPRYALLRLGGTVGLSGTFEDPVAPVFIDGKLDRTLRGDGLVAEFIEILEDYVARRFPGPGEAAVAATGATDNRTIVRTIRKITRTIARTSGCRRNR